MIDSNKELRCRFQRGISLTWRTAATTILILGLIGSVAAAQEGHIIKEIRVETKEGPYLFPDPILQYDENFILFQCNVTPINCEILKGYFNITTKDNGKVIHSKELNVTSGKIDNQNVIYALKKGDPLGVYIASIDLITSNTTSIPDAGAYVSLNVGQSEVPVIIKFEDLNGDGKFDEVMENGLKGWEFRVVDPQGNVATEVTGNDGKIYLRPSAIGYNYVITEDPNHEASMGWESIPTKEMDNEKYVVKEGENEFYFANRLKPASLIIAKFEDRNKNDKFDEGEGLPNREFQVTAILGPEFSKKVTTDNNGFTRAEDLVLPFKSVTGHPEEYPTQKYSIVESPRAVWMPIQTIVRELHPGEVDTVYIQNSLPGGRIIVHKYEDINGNNRYDKGEGCPAGWAITLTGLNTNLRATTNESGFAVFDVGFTSDPRTPGELPRNTYIVHEELRDGWVKLQDQKVELSPGEVKIVDFRNMLEPGIIVVQKYEDINLNGIGDAGEERMGWTFSVDGPGVRSPTATTNASGMASFVIDFASDYSNPCQPPLRTYMIHEVPKEGYVEQSDQKVELGPGELKQSRFVNRFPDVLLTIQKFFDANKNGIRDPGEDNKNKHQLSGWEFDVVYQGAKRTLTTDADGRINISLPGVLPEALCTVTENLSGKPGWVCTTSNPQQLKVSSRVPALVAEFGNNVNQLVITKFNDTNQNGAKDENEGGLPGWTFTVQGPNGFKARAGPTNADGIAVLEGLSPGDYAIAEDLVDGWINTTPNSQFVSIKSGEVNGVYFGNIKGATVEIFKFNDTNNNGRLDASENGTSGWMFVVDGPSGFNTEVGPTNERGLIVLEGMRPGDYIITESPKDRWINTTSSKQTVTLRFGDHERATFGNYYCERCHRIFEPKTPINATPDIIVSKSVSNISAEDIDGENGYVVNYNIQICPSSRGMKNISAVPTDIVIAVDNSPSINNLKVSAITGAQNLVRSIKENDNQGVTRVGLVSWSDVDNSKIEVPLENNYSTIISTVANITFAKGTQTDFQEGLNVARKAFQGVPQSVGRAKKMVFITDANDSGYHGPTEYPGSEYTIYAIVVGDNKETNAYKILDKLTKEYHGYVVSIKNQSELEVVLAQMSTAEPIVEDVHLVEVLPNYLVLLNSTATDDRGNISLNGDSRDWTTTTIEWDIGDLSDCWSTDFQAVFCWKLPADVDQSRLTSYVNYTDGESSRRTVQLPEYEIHIVRSTDASQKPQNSLLNTEAAEVKQQPGFESLLAAMVLCTMGYLYRRRS